MIRKIVYVAIIETLSDYPVRAVFALTMLIALSLFCHMKSRPFAALENNSLESISLLCLFVIITTSGAFFSPVQQEMENDCSAVDKSSCFMHSIKEVSAPCLLLLLPLLLPKSTHHRSVSHSRRCPFFQSCSALSIAASLSLLLF